MLKLKVLVELKALMAMVVITIQVHLAVLHLQRMKLKGPLDLHLDWLVLFTRFFSIHILILISYLPLHLFVKISAG